MKTLAVLGLALVAAGCVPTRFDSAPLASRHLALAAIGDHRLGDTRPYVLAREGEVTLFLCRWDRDGPIPVRLAAGVTDAERRIVAAALGAWEATGVGVRFEPRAAGDEGIQIVFRQREEGDRIGSAATTFADCRVEPGAGSVLRAGLVSARITLRRADFDFRGELIPYSEEAMAGTLLHELGHALGFQGHVRRGDSVMVRTTAHVARLGRRLLAGEHFEAPSVRALYAVPSGSVVQRLSVSRDRTALADRMFVLAPVRGLRGPFARVGDKDARLAWRDGDGRWLPLMIFEVDAALREPRSFELVPMGATRAFLKGSSAGG